MKQNYLLLCCLLFLGNALAQQDSSGLALEEVVISTDRWQQYNLGASQYQFDSLSIGVNALKPVGELLRKEAGLSFRNTGNAALSTLSLRGTGAGHSTVWWNGFNLQNSMNGVQDFNLLPVAMTDEAMLQYGSMGALPGSGVLGGGLFLKNTMNIDKGWSGKLGLSTGSWEASDQLAVINLGLGKTSHSLRVFHHSAADNYPFKDLGAVGTPVRRLENSASRMLAVLQENYITFSDNHQWQIVSWYQDTYRQIPPSMTEANQQAYQQDRSLRLAVNQNLQLKNIVIRNRFARFSEFLRYGSDILTPEDSRAVSWLAESEVEYRIRSRHLLRAGVYAALQNAEVAAYTEKVRQQRWSAMASWRFDISPVFSTVLNLRQEVQGRGKAPFTPAFGWQWRLSKQWLWKGNISRNYRLPTFNDLYWQETFAKGNPDLLPESGWAEEMTWIYHSGSEKSGWEASMTLFSLQIRDWIHWLPQGNTWQPENLSAVWSKGAEMSFKSHFFVKSIRFQWSAKYLLTQSTIIEVENQQLIQGLHKQLTYVPVHQGVTGVKVFLKNWYAEYLHQGVDKRFTNFDNSETVAAYQTGSLSIAYQLKTTAAGLTFQLGMDNIWNTRYQSIAWRPMPGRSWQLQVRADL